MPCKRGNYAHLNYLYRLMTFVSLSCQSRTRTWLFQTRTSQLHPIISKELNSRGSSRKSSVRLDYGPESSRGRSKRSLGFMRRPWADTTRARYRGYIEIKRREKKKTSFLRRGLFLAGKSRGRRRTEFRAYRIELIKSSIARFRHATLIALIERGGELFLFSSTCPMIALLLAGVSRWR